MSIACLPFRAEAVLEARGEDLARGKPQRAIARVTKRVAAGGTLDFSGLPGSESAGAKPPRRRQLLAKTALSIRKIRSIRG